MSDSPDSKPEPPRNTKPFWPSADEARAAAWGFGLFFSLFIIAMAPLLLILPFRALPAGDDVLIVILRIGLVIGFMLAYRLIVLGFVRFARRFFAGKVSRELRLWLEYEEPEIKPTLREVVLKNSKLGLFAILGLLVAFGQFDFDAMRLDKAVGPKRFRGLLAVIQWCRGNPNTVKSSAVLITIGCVSLYAYRLHSAWSSANASSGKNERRP